MTLLCNGRVLASRVRLADSFFSRFKGLMGRKNLDNGEGLLLKRCSSVHSFFMKIPIDVVYLSMGMTVLNVETLKPWRVGSLVRGAVQVLELEAGAACVEPGDLLELAETGL